jgi:hypothetical protein
VFATATTLFRYIYNPGTDELFESTTFTDSKVVGILIGLAETTTEFVGALAERVRD